MLAGFLTRARPWLAAAGVVLVLVVALPPVGSDARRYAAVQALQFVIFAVVGPALLMLGWPRRLAGPGRTGQGRGETSTTARLGSADRPALRAGLALLPFMALVIVWRLPAVLQVLARDPALTAVELLTLLVAGSAVWLELTGTAPWPASLPYPARAAMAAIAMWTIWAIAYVTGMSSTTLGASGQSVAPALSAAANQQIGVAIMWAVPAICFVPVVYAMVMTWLGKREEAGRELRTAEPAAAELPALGLPDLSGPPRPPRGWR